MLRSMCGFHLGFHRRCVACCFTIARAVLQVALSESFGGICNLRDVVNMFVSSETLVDENREIFGRIHNV